ncbi:MAG: signal recognition particle-docking protein FtsY [Candidatus Eisenbacteria bacterium]|nr:signal recognition particle-docking protein FtsY [Candidatus Eisenbacteria bacterium]
MSRFSRLLDGLAKTRRAIESGLRAAFASGRLDEQALLGLEETLLAADVGAEMSTQMIEALRLAHAAGGADEGAARALLAREIETTLTAARRTTEPPEPARPRVVMVVGVNGVGKTTTIGKLAARHTASGRSVVLAAADTFRAAAGEQLSVWAQRSGAHFVGGQPGGDPAAVAFDALSAAATRGADVLIVDTAGRLHTRSNLLAELQKVKRVLARKMPGAPHDVLLVLDANTGQNALEQARQFDDALGLSGIVLAKLDGTARGGIVVAIAKALGLSVTMVGTGESVEDLEEFDARAFARGLVGLPDEGPPQAP